MTTSFSIQVSESVRTISLEGLFGYEFGLETVLMVIMVLMIIVVVAAIYVITKE